MVVAATTQWKNSKQICTSAAKEVSIVATAFMSLMNSPSNQRVARSQEMSVVQFYKDYLPHGTKGSKSS